MNKGKTRAAVRLALPVGRRLDDRIERYKHMREQRFGIEVEMTGITRAKAAEVIAGYFGTVATQRNTARDRSGRTWSVKADASIRSQKKSRGQKVSAGQEYSVEVVSPILVYSDIEGVQEIIRRLRKAGGFVNSSCGIHIHVDGANHSPKTLKNLINLMQQKEDILYKALQIDSQRLRYCQKVNEDMVTLINQRKPQTFQQLADLWYTSLGSTYNRSSHYNQSRYHGLNLHSTFAGQTVEFRCFNSTLHAGEVKAYIQFVLALSHQGITQKRASSRRSISDNEKYTMRCWLLRLGLNGEEFETCRLHMTKHLDGDCAWRHGRPSESEENTRSMACGINAYIRARAATV